MMSLPVFQTFDSGDRGGAEAFEYGRDGLGIQVVVILMVLDF
jgi:hypothetical protein